MRPMRMWIFVALATAVVTPPAAAQRSHIGLHGGYNFDVDKGLIGAQLQLPFGFRSSLYTSFDYYFVDPGSLIGYSVDLKINGRLGSPFYLGGGLSFLRTSGGGISHTDTGGDFFLGIEGRRRTNHPYVELRLLLHDDTSLQLAAGLNFTLF